MKFSLTLTLKFIICVLSLVFLLYIGSCASAAASAEEYYSIGMAYFELGQFKEAEQWLLRAVTADRTRFASEYNLGRIAFETGRYSDASTHFENILTRDPDNILALKAAAYTRIRMGDLEIAESLYIRVLALVPESSDDGYNYSLVLYALGKYSQSEEVLLTYPFALDDNPDSLLLLARARAGQNKPEAIDDFARWISINDTPNPKVHHEYALALENAGFYALALENFRSSLDLMPSNLHNLEQNQVQFDIARLLFIADPGNPEGISALNLAISQGFDVDNALQILSAEHRISQIQMEEIRMVLIQ